MKIYTYRTIKDRAIEIEREITNACINDNIWKDNITNSYGVDIIDEWGYFQELKGYEMYFEPYLHELERVQDI